MKRFATLLLAAAVLTACDKPHNPATPFAENAIPPAPDYTDMANWAAHPDLKDEADGSPDPVHYPENQAHAPADVFFIHPTTWNEEGNWNGDVGNAELNAKTDGSTIRHQASVFNSSCRVYAPRYRQAVYGSFFQHDLQNTAPAMRLAYADVKRAFEHYLATENEGRPIVIATHSQGTLHGIQLMKDFFDGKPLQKQLVAAYLVGWAVPADTFAVLRPCQDPGETGCFNTWCTFIWGYEPAWVGTHKKVICVNPITWRTEGAYAAPAQHKGAVLKDYDKVRPGICDAQTEKGLLWVHKPKFPGSFLITMKNLHIADYNLFWADIRANAELRVKTYVEQATKR